MKKKNYMVNGVLCFPKKHWTIQEIEQYFKEEDERDKRWKDWISDEEYEKRFKKKKYGNRKIVAEKHIRFKFEYEEPDCFGEVWSDEPYSVPYFTEKLGRGAIPVYVTNIEEYEDIIEWSSYYDETNKGDKN